ncbi:MULTISPECIES: tyrosinase family protein [unclassified Streptomyces]|uniref:tyrosinase family protein n=1 Tax=unclassified Streptomyces TaxID=2593676 RepID=UPI0023662773|nr:MULTISPECIES: tyrosinase family protein [unclassified Streptomyces]MDF3142080.1 tyrosinase family protein [Streptomyces sp. T21Q-yed]WDF43051.1 tyrosinase family protein [Streptomyces sp. T12]
MIRGDGIRRNIAQVDADEVSAFIDAIKQLQTRHYPGNRDDFPVGGVSQWYKQDEIHQATHVHGGPEFIPWHRELCNRFEQLIRSVDPRLSLHYWDWTTDPSPLFTPSVMGSKSGEAGEPWLSAGFYNPTADPYRGDAFDPEHANPFDPPRSITRAVPGEAPQPPFSDADIIGSPDYRSMRIKLEGSHNSAHGYIGGTISDGHTAFRDPFVFLLHANVDRLYAMWQYAEPVTRLDPTTVYGVDPAEPMWYARTLQPWDGNGNIRPWTAPENEQVVKDYQHPSVVTPPQYDTLPAIADGYAIAQKLDDLRHLLEDPAVLQAVRTLLPA